MINRKIPWTSQPQYPVDIDRSNPLGARVVYASTLAGIAYDAATGKINTNTAAVHKVTQRGVALNFNGSSAFITLPTTNLVSGYPLTVSCWFEKTTSVSQVIYSLNGSGYSAIAGYTPANLNLSINVGSNPGTLGYPFASIPAGWNHLVVVHKSGSFTMYLNGVDVTAATTGSENWGQPAAGNHSIGQRLNGASPRWFNGGIQDFIVLSGEVTPAEAAQLYANPYQIFKAPSRRIWVGAAGGTNTAVNPGTGSIAITGYAPSIAQTANQAITPNVGNIVITGYAPSINQPLAVNPAVGSLAITGYAPTVAQNVDIPVNPGVGSIAITGYTPAVAQTANQSIASDVGNITITGYSPTIGQPQSANPLAGTITITGYVPTVTQNVDNPINPSVGSIAITGYAPTVSQTANQSVLPAVGNVAITGYSPTVAQSANQAVLPNVGSLAITGYSPIVQQAPASQSLVPAAGTITITGYAPTVDQSSPIRLGGFEYGSKVYIKRGKKIVIFDSIEEADSYIEAEAKVEEIVQQSNRTSRLARKRAREKAFKSLAIEPVDTVDIPALKTLVAQLQTDFELPKLIAQQDWQRVVEIYNQAMEMQDEEDLLLIL